MQRRNISEPAVGFKKQLNVVKLDVLQENNDDEKSNEKEVRHICYPLDPFVYKKHHKTDHHQLFKPLHDLGQAMSSF